MVPFIHLFRSPNSGYFYDVNKDKVVCVNDHIYAFLSETKDIPENIDSIEELEISDREELKSLIDNGFLSDNHVERIEHYHTSDLEYQVKNRMNELILQVTQACNLSCSYCPFANKTDNVYQRNHSGKKMNWETAKKSIDLFEECSSEIDEVSITFYGGEPFLNFPLIQKVIDYSNKLFIGKKVRYALTTNGTLLTDVIIDYIFKNNISVMFSIDGPASIHDMNRKKADGSGSYDEAVRNLKKLSAIYGEKSFEKLSINSVINTETDFDEILKLFDDPFFLEKKVGIQATLVSSDMLEKQMEYREDFKQKFNYNSFISLMKILGVVNDIKLDPISELFSLLQLVNIGWNNEECAPLASTGAPGGPCIPGQRRFFVNADGNFYPCERVNELAEDTQLGNIKDGFDLEKAEKVLNIARLTENECKNCFAFRHCTVCVRKATDGNKFSAKHKLTNCAKVKKNLISNLKLIALREEIDSVYKRNMPL